MIIMKKSRNMETYSRTFYNVTVIDVFSLTGL